MISVKTEARRYVLKIYRKPQRLRLKRDTLRIIEMRLASIIAESESTQSLVTEADLRRLESRDRASCAVATYALLVNELYRRTARKRGQRMLVLERFQQGCDNRFR